MGLFIKFVWIQKALCIILSETINILRKLEKKMKFQDAPQNFTIGLCT